jgi:CSLREA domain-containing protein
MRKSIRIPLLTACIAAALLVPSAPAEGATLLVTRTDDPAPNGCQPNNCSLREAIIAANNRPGPDVIQLKGRTYDLTRVGANENNADRGDLDIKRDTTINGKGKNDTTIHAHTIDRAFHVVSPGAEVVLRDLEIKRGEDDAASLEGGGGIATVGQLTLQRVRLARNNAPSCCAGAIWASGNEARITIKGSIIRENDSSGCCGAMFLTSQARKTIINSRFVDNQAMTCCGGAIYNQGAGKIVVRSSSFDGNSTGQCCGGAIYDQGNGRILIRSSSFESNLTTNCCGGALYKQSGGRIVVRSSTFHDNSSTCCGGAIYAQDAAAVEVFGSTLTANETTECCGGAIYKQDERALTVRGSVLRNNKTGECCGGAIYRQDEGGLIVRASTLRRNTTGQCCGGAIYKEDTGFMRLRDLVVTRNETSMCCGGGIYKQNVGVVSMIGVVVADNKVAQCCGGGIYIQDGGKTTILDATVRENRAPENGGGIYTTGAPVDLLSSRVLLNRATTGCCGGGMAVDDGKVLINNTIFRKNKHLGVPNIPGGGGLYSTGDTVGGVPTTVKNSTFAGNTSTRYGGAVFTEGDGGITLINSTITGSEAAAFGGGFYEQGSGPVTLTHLTLTKNQAGGSGGGIGTDSVGPAIVIRGALVSGNDTDCQVAMTGATGTNLDKDSSCFAGGGALHGRARLLPLADNGGPTPTHALRRSSKAVDAVPGAQCPPPGADQRHVTRPKEGDGSGPTRCDLGAYERKP